MSILNFDRALVRKLVDHAKAAKKHRKTYGAKKAEAGLLIVGDQGVYLMSSGEPPLPSSEGGKPGSSLVAYAKGISPKDEDWWEEKRAVFGGDDGVDLLPLAGIEEALVACEKAGASFQLKVTPSSISILAPAQKRRLTGAAAVASLEAASATVKAKLAGLTVTLEDRDDARKIPSLREAAKLCRFYIEEYGLGMSRWNGGEVKLDGKVVARISYNGRAWDMRGRKTLDLDAPTLDLDTTIETLASAPPKKAKA